MIGLRAEMTLQLNPEMLAHAYEYLSCQPPFNAWNLPPSEDVKFSVNRKKDRFAYYQMIGGVHHIVFSSRFVGRHELLIATMAHEMIHVHQEHSCINFRNPHDSAFQKYADRICKIHEFDRLIF